MDFGGNFIKAENWYGPAKVLFDHSYVTGWHRDKALLNAAVQDSAFLYLYINVNAMIRNTKFEENYELMGTFVSYSEFMHFDGRDFEITDSVFRHCTGTLSLNTDLSYVTILIRNTTIESHFTYFDSVLNIHWKSLVTLTDVHFVDCFGSGNILAIDAPVIVLESVEFTNNRLLDRPQNTILTLSFADTALSNCTFTNNGGYTDSYADYFFYNHLLALGLINPYPEIAKFFDEASSAICYDLIYIYFPSSVTVSNVTISGDLEKPCNIPIDINSLAAKKCGFSSVLIAGGSSMGLYITAYSGYQLTLFLANCIFKNLNSAFALYGTSLLATNTTFTSIGTPLIHATYPPLYIYDGNIYLQDCYFLNGSGAFSGAVFIYISDSFTQYVLNIINCTFDNNTVIPGGATDLIVSSGSVTLPVTVEIRDCVFRNSIGVYPSVSMLISSIIVGSAVMANCTFISTQVMNMGLIQLQTGGGTFYIRDILFDSINSPGNDLIYLQALSSPSYYIFENLHVRHCVFSSCIKIIGTSLNTTSCRFESNTGIVLDNSALYYEDHGSYFYDNTNDCSPCNSQSSGVKSAFYGTSFVNNRAAQVGVIEIIGPDSFARFEDCQFDNNSATTSGVMHLTSTPDVQIKNCTFLNNFANSGSVFLFERALLEVLITSSVFRNNTGSGLLKSIYSTVRMINVTFTDLDFTEKDYQIMLLSNSKFTLENSTVASLHGLQGEGNCLLSMLMGSAATVNNTVLSGLQCTQNVITVMLNSSLSLIGSSFRNVSSSGASLIHSSTQSQLLLQSTHFANISVVQGVLFTQHTDISLFNSSFYNIQGAMMLHVESCKSVLIQSTNFYAATVQTAVGAVQSVGCAEVTIRSSNFTDINAITTAGVQVYNGNLTIDGCVFQQLRANSHGAIEIEGGSLSISQSRFSNNSAGKAPDSFGGAVYLNSLSNISISSNTFTRNNAVAGGAVYWNSNQSMSELNTHNSYEGNSALYGPNIASSSFKLIYDNDSIPVLASGQVCTGSMIIKIVDQLGQVVATDSTTKALMVLTSGNSLTGALVSTAVHGIFSLSGFSVIGVPGTSANITILPNTGNCVNTSVTFPLRDCAMGEIEVFSGACVICTTGTYSLSVVGTSCSNCFPDATCINGSAIYPNPGYWRPAELYDGLLQCPNSAACTNTPILTSTTGICADGYTGNLCQSCAEGYSRNGKDKCAECPSQVDNIIRLSFLAFAIFIFIVFLVRSALKSAAEKKNFIGVYMKILMSYLQIIVLIENFDLKWTSVLKEMFNIHSFLGSSGEQFVSLDCVVSEPYFKKLILISLLPILLLVANILIWALYHFFRTVEDRGYKLICSLVVTLLYVHPIIVQTSLSAFHCTEIKSGEKWVRDEMDIQCWDRVHSSYTLGVALPTLILWVFGIPALFFLMLRKHRKRLSALFVKKTIGFLSIGFKHNYYYWEIVIVYRKVCIILLYVFSSSLPDSLQALALCILLWTAGSFQTKFQAYQTAELNTIEERSLWVCIITIYSGIFFSINTLSVDVQLTLSAAVILVNVYFLALWAFFFSREFLVRIGKKNPRFARFLPCLRVPEIETIPERDKTLPSLKKQLYLAKLYSQVEQLSEV